MWLLQALPPGASKGAGVARLLKVLEVPPGNVMAIGAGCAPGLLHDCCDCQWTEETH